MVGFDLDKYARAMQGRFNQYPRINQTIDPTPPRPVLECFDKP